jgi:hypothetical protein
LSLFFVIRLPPFEIEQILRLNRLNGDVLCFNGLKQVLQQKACISKQIKWNCHSKWCRELVKTVSAGAPHSASAPARCNGRNGLSESAHCCIDRLFLGLPLRTRRAPQHTAAAK